MQKTKINTYFEFDLCNQTPNVTDHISTHVNNH